MTDSSQGSSLISGMGILLILEKSAQFGWKSQKKKLDNGRIMGLGEEQILWAQDKVLRRSVQAPSDWI